MIPDIRRAPLEGREIIDYYSLFHCINRSIDLLCDGFERYEITSIESCVISRINETGIISG
jgi:hypothetical protein